MKKKSYKAIDLFAGIGGIRLGFSNLNCEFVFASEFNKEACKTYEANFNETPYGDISEISEKDIPKFDILLAGFPCQPFSQAGLQKGLNDTRGTLFFEIKRIAEYHKPKIIFLENVKRLRTHDKGKTLKIIQKTLKEIGYKYIHIDILNAKDFGVPQNRERIFIVAFREKVNFKFPEKLNKQTLLKDILENRDFKKYRISDKLWDGHKNRKAKNKREGKGFGYSSFNENSPYTNTLTARYYKDGAEILIEQDGLNPRLLTPREAARLQGFPDDFKIVCSDIEAYKQFGNSVAIPVIQQIAKKIFECL